MNLRMLVVATRNMMLLYVCSGLRPNLLHHRGMYVLYLVHQAVSHNL